MRRTEVKLKRTKWYFWIWELENKDPPHYKDKLRRGGPKFRYKMRFLSAKSALDYAMKEYGKRIKWNKLRNRCFLLYTSENLGHTIYTITKVKVK